MNNSNLNTFKNKVVLGTVQFGMKYGISNVSGQTSMNEVESLLKYSSEIGIDTLDTAFGYGDSENVLGNFDLSNFKVISKFLPEKISGRTMIDQHFLSLEKLKITKFYAYLAHRASDLIEDSNIWNNLKDLQQDGKVEKIGASLNETNELYSLIKRNMIPDVIQVPYNYFDRRFESWMVEMKNMYNTEIHTRSTFLQGLFFTDMDSLSSFFDPIKVEIKKLQDYRNDLPSSLLIHSLGKSFIDKVVMGVENVYQLDMNLSSLESAKILPEKDFEFPPSILIPSQWPT